MAEQNYYDMPPAEQRRQREQADRNSANETAGIPQPLRKYKKSTARSRRKEVRT